MQIDVGEKRRNHRSLSRPHLTGGHDPVFHDARLEPFLDQTDHARVTDPMLHELDEPLVAHRVEERADVGVQDVVHLLALNPNHERIHRIMRAASGSESIREPEEVFLVDRVEHRGCRPLDDLVFKGRNRERALTPVRLGNIYAPGRQCPIRSAVDACVQVLEPALEVSLVLVPRQPVHAGGGVLLNARRTPLPAVRR